MALAQANLSDIKRRILSAYGAEEPKLNELRGYARQLKEGVKPVREHSVNAVSFVSSDGGDNRINFNPGVVELVRVVDSRGNECAMDAIGENTQYESLNQRIEERNDLLVRPLKKMCNDLGMRVTDLSRLLNWLGKSGRSTGAMRVYRDIVEWAVLYDLLHKEWGTDTIVVRDGLLRTKSFEKDVYRKIGTRIRAVCKSHEQKNVNVSMVGVAKQSAVLSKLAITLMLEEVFYKNYPCYVKVPKKIELYCSNYDRTWLDTPGAENRNENPDKRNQFMGDLHLVKFGDSPFDPVWPVDIAVWDVKNADRIIGQLLNDAQPGFPIPDFPQCIQNAHDYAKIGGIEKSVLEDILFEGLMEKLNDAEKEKILRFRYLRENLTDRRYKNA